jgi:hypothetical protein
VVVVVAVCAWECVTGSASVELCVELCVGPDHKQQRARHSLIIRLASCSLM